MVYSDIQLTNEEKEAKKRRLILQQAAIDADLSRNKREESALMAENRNLRIKISRLEEQIKQNNRKLNKIRDNKTFLDDRLRHVKREIMDLRHFLRNIGM